MIEEIRSVLDADEVLEELLSMGVPPEDLEPLDYSVKKKYYEIISESEWKRLLSIQAYAEKDIPYQQSTSS